ncbi:MAG: DNA-3-methyladenine glycosylase I [Planctomycetia bacterium]|nr:DNA-3-methyladenine glycosylase I [Planctomycetia bacterium]
MANQPRLITGADGQSRCWWCGNDPLYVEYHDHEWGVPVDDDVRLFEKICLEGFQAGLSWITVLRKRADFRKAFAGFEFAKVARFTDAKVEKLVTNAKLIRHRGKIESTINNAQQALKLVDEFDSLSAFFWQYAPDSQPLFDGCRSMTPESKSLSKELKRRGWSFVGPTTCYAFMQAVGMVNDHLPGCRASEKVEKLRKQFRPTLLAAGHGSWLSYRLRKT